MSRRTRALVAITVVVTGGALLGTAFASRSALTATTPKSSFSGTGSGSTTPSSGFSGSGTVTGGGGDGLGSDDSGSFGQEGGEGGGTLVLPSSGPGGALAGLTVSEVRSLQTSLAQLGYFHHAVTGYYGAVTTAAVKKFQRAVGLKADGIWGKRSAAALVKRLAG